VHLAKLFETIYRADARCQHQSAGRKWCRHYVRRRAGVQRGDTMYMSLVSHSVRTFVRVPAASLHDITSNVRINHIEARSRNNSYRGRAKVLHIFCVCVCVCVCSFSYRACKTHAPYYIVCGLTSAATFSHIIS
jgi:hypothetical protein